MATNHSGYSKAEKRAYVKRVRAGESYSSVAAEAGVSPQSLRAWVKKYPARPPKAPPEPATAPPAPAANGHAKASSVAYAPSFEAYLDARIDARVRELLGGATITVKVT